MHSFKKKIVSEMMSLKLISIMKSQMEHVKEKKIAKIKTSTNEYNNI